jgi:hypothetical protein
VHGDVPVAGSAHGGEDQEEAALRDGPADGVAPVGDEEAVFNQFPGNKLFDAAGQISDIAELAGLSDRKVLGEWGTTPGGKKDFGLVLLQGRLPRGWVGEGKGNFDLAKREVIDPAFDRRRKKVLSLVGRERKKDDGTGHTKILGQSPEFHENLFALKRLGSLFSRTRRFIEKLNTLTFLFPRDPPWEAL